MTGTRFVSHRLNGVKLLLHNWTALGNSIKKEVVSRSHGCTVRAKLVGYLKDHLIEAHNSMFNYDLISVCETNLNDTVDLPETLLDDYSFITANHPLNRKHGDVGLFYKNSLPITIRHDLSFEESIVVELKSGRKNFFLTVLYRSPSFNHTFPEFQAFLLNFKNLYSKIKAENSFAMFFAGDFNAKCHF